MSRENFAIAEQFVKENNNFQFESFINPLNNIKVDGQTQILPWDGDCDATFIAKFRKI